MLAPVRIRGWASPERAFSPRFHTPLPAATPRKTRLCPSLCSLPYPAPSTLSHATCPPLTLGRLQSTSSPLALIRPPPLSHSHSHSTSSQHSVPPLSTESATSIPPSPGHPHPPSPSSRFKPEPRRFSSNLHLSISLPPCQLPSPCPPRTSTTALKVRTVSPYPRRAPPNPS